MNNSDQWLIFPSADLWSTSPFPRLILITYTSFILLISFLGNGLIIYGSLRHNAIQIERISLLFLQNIALSDILITLVYYLPMFVTAVSMRWVFGEDICYFSAYFSWFIPTNNEMMIIATLSVYRLWILQKPKAYRDSIPINRVKILMFIIVLYSAIPAFVYIIAGFEPHFYPEYLTCATSAYLAEHKMEYINIVMSIVFVGLPVLIVITSNIAILYIFFISRSHLRSKSSSNLSVTLICICWMFVLSYLPIVVRDIVPDLERWYYTFQIYVMSINVVINPILILVKHKEFRVFVKTLLESFFCRWSGSMMKMCGNMEIDVTNAELLPNTVETPNVTAEVDDGDELVYKVTSEVTYINKIEDVEQNVEEDYGALDTLDVAENGALNIGDGGKDGNLDTGDGGKDGNLNTGDGGEDGNLNTRNCVIITGDDVKDDVPVNDADEKSNQDDICVSDVVVDCSVTDVVVADIVKTDNLNNAQVENIENIGGI